MYINFRDRLNLVDFSELGHPLSLWLNLVLSAFGLGTSFIAGSEIDGIALPRALFYGGCYFGIGGTCSWLRGRLANGSRSKVSAKGESLAWCRLAGISLYSRIATLRF